MKKFTKILLSEKEIPRQWYNIAADMPNKPLPPLHPVTREPIGPEALAAVFPMELIKQEMSAERYIDIPNEVIELYKTFRPSPLYRAVSLEKASVLKVKSTISMKGAIILVPIKPIPPLPRLITTKRRELKGLQRKPGPVSGEAQ